MKLYLLVSALRVLTGILLFSIPCLGVRFAFFFFIFELFISDFTS